MPTIEQARADRARDALNRTIEQQQIAQRELYVLTARADTVRMIAAKADSIEGNDGTKAAFSQATRTSDAGMVHTASGPNPFAALTRSESAGDGVLVLAEALPLDTELAPGVEQMWHLGTLQGEAFKQSTSDLHAAADKVRTGTLLLLTDDAAAAQEKLGEAQPSANELAGTLLENADTATEKPFDTIISQHIMSNEMPAGVDINAYVEQVLRESYMIQQGVLKDYGDQMSAINDQRKKYSAQLAKQRDAKTKVANGERLTAEDLEALGITLTDDDLTALEGDQSSSSGGTDDPPTPKSPADDQQNKPAGAHTPPPWSPSFASHFGEVLIVDPAGTQSVLDYAASYGGQKEKDRYGHLNKDPATLLTALTQGGATRPVDQLGKIFGAALYGVEKTGNVDASKAFVTEALDDLTYDQLNGLKGSDPKLWNRINLATGGAGDQRLKQFSDLRSAGLEGATPESDQAVQLFMLAQAHDPQSPWMEQALAAMHGLKTADAIDALKTIATGLNTPVAPEIFDQLFFACDPSQLLKNNSDRTSLDFVLAIKGGSADIVNKWKEAPANPQTDGLKENSGAQTAAPGTTDAPADSNAPQATTAAADSSDGGTKLPKNEVDSILASASADKYKTLIGDKLDNLVNSTQDKLNSAGGDAEAMQLQLQDALQKSQELMQMMSNMSKVIHDTVMAVIRNIGG